MLPWFKYLKIRWLANKQNKKKKGKDQKQSLYLYLWKRESTKEYREDVCNYPLYHSKH